jgi:hypothetical protein
VSGVELHQNFCKHCINSGYGIYFLTAVFFFMADAKVCRMWLRDKFIWWRPYSLPIQMVLQHL